MTSHRALRQLRFDERNAARAMLTLGTEREKLRAELRGVLEDHDRDRAVALVAQIKQVDRDYANAAARRSAARRQLLDEHKEDYPR